MIFEKEDEKKLKKLGVYNLLDLALMTPSSYEDRNLYHFIRLNELNALDATIESFSITPKYIKLLLFAHNLNQTLPAYIFNPKAFHKKAFEVSKRYFLIARIESRYGHIQAVQPRIIDTTGEIIPKYKNRSIKNQIKKYLTKERLSKYRLREEEILSLYEIHFPTSFKIEHYEKTHIKVLKFVEVYNYMLKLSKKKKFYKSSRVIKADPLPFIKSLPFKLTGDQLKAIRDIQNDFAKEFAGKRVVMGDVGCGKTMVILASAFMMYPFKSVLMAPTTVLVSQIYEEAKKYLPSTFKTALITNKSKADEDLSSYDFIIGTHALLYRKLPQCDLVMVDEQHRFGTLQREMIKKLISKDKLHPHYLQFSATPIPRTMSLIDSNLVDYSFIKELPFKKDITTKIITKNDFKELVRHIKSESAKNHQTIVVYPLVEESETIDYLSIEEAKEYWLKHFDSVFVTHGKDREKEDILEEFKEKGKVLIATTLIEVGISLPSLTTIVIVAPERMGLATLHQLRGRVSRNGLKGYCFLFTKTPKNSRLNAFCKTLNGFEIAKLDLKFRQSGDILRGEYQSGKSFRFFDPSQDEDIALEAKRRVGG